MAKLPIVIFPDPILREHCLPVERVDDEMRRLLDDMMETMYSAPGVGLAAPQVGVLRRVLVMDPGYRKTDEPADPYMLINPEIVSVGETPRVYEEGCLSIPEMYAEVERPASVRVRYIDRDGTKHERLFEEHAATVVQHEIDHLNGILFPDYLSRLKRDRLIRKFRKGRREAAL
jgi:peptide deformylase